MIKIIKSYSLRVKLTIALLLVAIIPLLLLSKLFFIGSEEALRKSTLAQLGMSAEYKVGEIHLFLETLKINTTDFASDGFIKNELVKITSKLSSAQQLNNHLIENKLPAHSELMFIDVVNIHGVIVASTISNRIGKDLSAQHFYQKGLSQSYIANLSSQSNSPLLGTVASPILSNDKTQFPLGVLINHYRMNTLPALFTGELLSKLGAKSEYRKLSPGESIYMLTPKGNVITTSKQSLAATPLTAHLATYPIEQIPYFAQENKGIWKNHLGISVLGVSILVKIDDLAFILVAEQEVEQAFLSVNTLKNQFYLLLIFTVIIIIALSLVLAFFIIQPLNKVINSLDIIASGEFDIDIKQVNQYDELGNLVGKFNNMAKKLKKMKSDSDSKNQQLLELSIRDHLTGLFNHRYLIEYGEIRVLEANRNNMTLGLLMIDIDHFKLVNDRYGHPCGDYVITEIALLLKDSLRKIDILARYGGEEFAVIMPNTTAKKAGIVAEKLCKSIAAHNFIFENKHFDITVSIGVAIKQESENRIMEIISRADQALYQSKHNGRNQVSLNSPATNNNESVA